MFAPEGDGCLNRARREDAGRIHKAGTTLCDFWYFWSYKSTIKEKFLYAKDNTSSVSLWLTPSPAGEGSLPAFSFEEEGAKEKATKKKTPKEDFALCGALTQSRRRRHTRSAYVSIPTAVGGRHRLPQKAGENFNCGCAKTLFWCSKNKVKNTKPFKHSKKFIKRRENK